MRFPFADERKGAQVPPLEGPVRRAGEERGREDGEGEDVVLQEEAVERQYGMSVSTVCGGRPKPGREVEEPCEGAARGRRSACRGPRPARCGVISERAGLFKRSETHLDDAALVAREECVVPHGERKDGVAVAREGRDGEEVRGCRAPQLDELVTGCGVSTSLDSRRRSLRGSRTHSPR